MGVKSLEDGLFYCFFESMLLFLYFFFPLFQFQSSFLVEDVRR